MESYEEEETQGNCPTEQEQLISMWRDEYFDELTLIHEWELK